MRSFDNYEWTKDGKFQSTIPEENKEHARLVREAQARYEEGVNESFVPETSLLLINESQQLVKRLEEARFLVLYLHSIVTPG